MPEIKYAIYPGSVRLYDGSIATFTAAELAAVYSVEDEDYLVVPDDVSEAELASSLDYFKYIHLKPRADNEYFDQKDAKHDQKDDTVGEDYDGSKQYIQETKQPYSDIKD